MSQPQPTASDSEAARDLAPAVQDHIRSLLEQHGPEELDAAGPQAAVRQRGLFGAVAGGLAGRLTGPVLAAILGKLAANLAAQYAPQLRARLDELAAQYPGFPERAFLDVFDAIFVYLGAPPPFGGAAPVPMR